MRGSRLETVKRLRALGERQARVRWALSVAAEAAAAEMVESGRRAVDSVVSKPGRFDAGHLQAAHLRGVAAVDRLGRAGESHRESVEKAELDRIDWSKARSDAEAADRLIERRRSELAALASRTSADALDDLVAILRTTRTDRKDDT